MFKDEIKHLLAWLWFEHRGKLLGFSAGTLLGVLILLIGFFQTLFIAVFAAAGVWLGNAVDKGEDVLGQLKDWRPGGFSRYK